MSSGRMILFSLSSSSSEVTNATKTTCYIGVEGLPHWKFSGFAELDDRMAYQAWRRNLERKKKKTVAALDQLFSAHSEWWSITAMIIS